MNVKLRTNLIVGGVFLKEGTILDLQKIPSHLRKKRYILREGERDLKQEEREKQMQYAEGEIDAEDLLIDLGNGPENLVRRASRR